MSGVTVNGANELVVDENGKNYVVHGNGHHSNLAFDKTLDVDERITPPPTTFYNEKVNNLEVVTETVDDEKAPAEEEAPKTVSLWQLFRFADKIDILLMLLATLCSFAHGTGLPLLILIFGDMTQNFIESPTGSGNGTNGTSVEEFLHKMQLSCAGFAGIGGAVLIIGYGQVAFWLMTSHRQTFKIRAGLLRAVLRQDISWFDTNDSGGISNRLSDDVNKIQEGIGDKLGAFSQWVATCLTGLIIALVKGWKLSLVCLSFSPLIAMCGAVMTKLATKSSTQELSAYAKAGAIATEVFSCIKTVLVFGGHEKECQRYSVRLADAKKVGVQKSIVTGAGMGLTFFILNCSYCLGFWYGGKLVRNSDMLPGNLITVFFCIMFASMAIGNASPSWQMVGQARGAAFYVWSLIDRTPEIDSSSNNGQCPSSFIGNVDFVDVSFRYPSRPDVPILNGLTLTVKNGQTAALVGSSGCGKSTVIQLLQRFYDPLDGSVLVDGRDIKQLNIRWLRQHIGVVSQEPILFATTIAENIRYGRDGISQQDIERAAEMANAHSFISELPSKYETLVGDRGAQLSGGQKQRIAIARALVRDPKILLLDEATSALDNESEAIVQAALDKARQGRTTIVVAHRLSTIRTADVIFGFKAGRVDEYGTHESLMEKEGIYYQLVTSQRRRETDSEESSDTEGEMSEIELLDGDLKLSAGSLRRSRHSVRRSLRKNERKANVAQGEKDEQEENEENMHEVGLTQLLRHNAKEWYYILLGCINSLLHGASQPVMAILFAGFLGVFATKYTPEDREHMILIYALMYLVLGFVAGLSYFLTVWFFGLSGEALTMRMRMATFRALLRQDMSFYDNPKNSCGALTTRLATDASAIQGATGVRLGMMLQAFATIIVGLIIAFIFSWKFALFVFGIMPFMLAGAVMQTRIAKGFSMKNKSELEEAGKVASEAVSNIRTVASLSKEEKFINDYLKKLEPSYKQSLKTAHLFGIAFSFMQAMIFFCDAAIFYFGAWLIAYDGLDYESMFKVFGAIIFGAFSLGRESQFAPDYAKAKISAARIFALLAKEPGIDNYSTEGRKPNQCLGRIELRNVEFSYPNRPSVKVMKDAYITVEPGKTFALVGQTGCGKSTTIQLLERLYDPLAGQVLLDGNDVRELNVSWLRSQLGLVSQEPVLFDYSIRENIQYGDNSRDVSMDEVIAAARAANIHNFIEALPNGYETRVGDKGTQLSGGQKQRIAIARALVRNPKILLLDEATSALDTESEKIVQEALDRAQYGRTCLVIAHRLSTIQNAHQIVVFENGKVSEQGTHGELMNTQGLYYKLQTTHAK